MLVTRLALLATLVAVVAAVVATRRRRWVWRLGPYGRELAAPFLIILWFAGLNLGQLTGSLVGMACVAAAPVVAVAVVATVRSRPVRWRGARWGVGDWLCFAFLGAFALLVAGADNLCHYAVVSTFLRGNIPPVALNDPTQPLVYHHLFDAAAAVVSRALHVDAELALDVVTIVCVAGTIQALVVVSRLLFAAPRAQAAARLLYLLGFGPVVFRLLAGDPISALHGTTIQPLVDTLLRRPMALNNLLFTFALAALLTRLRAPAVTRRAATVHLPALALLPLLHVLPAASEELVLFVGLAGLIIVATRGLRPVWLLAGTVTLALGAPFSGVIRGVLTGSSMAVPHTVLAWPPILPNWGTPAGSLPLFSSDAVAVLLTEYGPVFALGIGLALARGSARHRLVVALIALGFVAAVSLTLQSWTPADTDRFLFYGANAGFLLAAAMFEGPRAPPWRAVAVAAAAVTIAGPVALGSWRAATQRRSWSTVRAERPGEAIRRALAVVGARETVMTDPTSAQVLVTAGFIVIAPMDSHMVGKVIADRFDQHVRRHAGRADWYFVAPDDPRAAGASVAATYAGNVLVRARR